MLFLMIAAICALVAWYRLRQFPKAFRRHPAIPAPGTHAFNAKKPEWVPKAVVRLRALMPYAGCRHIATTFNSRYGHKGETVGKTYVASVIKRKALSILNRRKKLKNRATKQGPRNLTWAADLTFLPESKSPVFGILDHGARASLALIELRTRTTIGILRILLDLFERFGRPRFFRTDNEAVFASSLLTTVLWTLGIRHQRTDPFCPWQNGRIERFLGTFKERTLKWWAEAGVPSEVQPDLDTIRVWYNHVRPHQGLASLTPAEAWSGSANKGPLRFFSAWNGILAGFGRPT